MKRPIRSHQRQMMVLSVHLNTSPLSVSGIDSDEISVVKNGVGDFTFTMSEQLRADYSVFISPYVLGTFHYIQNKTTTTFNVIITDNSGFNEDRDIDLLIVGVS